MLINPNFIQSRTIVSNTTTLRNFDTLNQITNETLSRKHKKQTDTNQIQHEILSHRYKLNHNQITIKTLNQLNTMEREKVVTCDRCGATTNQDPNTHQQSHPKYKNDSVQEGLRVFAKCLKREKATKRDRATERDGVRKRSL